MTRSTPAASWPDFVKERNGRLREPIGHSLVVPHECPSCRRLLAKGYSCPRCCDAKGELHLATPIMSQEDWGNKLSAMSDAEFTAYQKARWY